MAGAGLIGCIHASLQETAALPSACGTRQRLYRASAALGKGPSANFKSAKGSLPSIFYRALGKGFAECLLGGTRQRKVTVMTGYKLTVVLPSVSKKGTRQIIFLKKSRISLPSAQQGGTRQRNSGFFKKNSLPSVSRQDTWQRN